MGNLFVVGTPIGNLGDFSPRAVEILSSVQFIAAEDTRVSLKLLNHFDIHTPILSYHEHNAHERGPELIDRLLNGENGAIITDAGMPCISDPGELLVSLCHDNGIPVCGVPGPTAAMTALAISGLPSKYFCFEGFLPVKSSDRDKRLSLLAPYTQTLIFYEAPHKLRRTLTDLFSALGNRRISLCREITKVYEEVERTTLKEAIDEYSSKEPRGEYVLIVEGFIETGCSLSFDEAVLKVRSLVNDGMSLKEASKQVAFETGLKKSDLYNCSLT